MMKLLNRVLNKTEKILLFSLCFVLLFAFYYFAVDRPVVNGVQRAQEDVQNLELELSAIQIKIGNYRRMEEDLKNNTASYMLSYNGSNQELKLLHKIFSKTQDYNIKFTDLTREGDQIRRAFFVSYNTKDFDQARAILNQIINSEYRCLVNDVTMNQGEDGIQVTANAIFYETMVGGKEDAALPKDTGYVETFEDGDIN